MKFKFLKAALTGLVLCASGFTHAGLIVNIVESSGNVEVSYSGSINLDALLGFFGTSESYDGYQSISGNVAFTNGEVDTYSVDITNWTQFGFGGFDFWDVSNGDSFALFSNPLLGLPSGYISGDVLSGTATQLDTSFAALGFETGSYLNTLSFEGITDTIVINVGQEVKVPVPSTLALFALGVFGLATRVFKN